MARSERNSQNRVARLFTTPPVNGGLGYEHLGNWSKRDHNRAIEVDLLRANLSARGYSPSHISAALQKLEVAVDVTGITPYQANLRTYQLLRYGVPVQIAAGQSHETVQLIDWAQPERNHFALAEEVTLRGGSTRRPDIVLYINGLAVAVIELKRSSVDVGDGIRQLCSNQEETFNQGFFSTVQLLLAAAMRKVCATAPPAHRNSSSCSGRMNNRQPWQQRARCWIVRWFRCARRRGCWI